MGDLLDAHNAPRIIDFLSIDTEGSELSILQEFDFSSRQINIVACEHNFGPDRGIIYKLLSKNGYRRVWKSVSRFDDWYIHPNAKY